MARTLIVPPQVISRLREGAHLQLANAAYEIASSATAWHKDAAPHEEHYKMEQLWTLLDAIGWAGAVPGPVELDLATHSLALLVAIGEIEPNLLEWLAEMPDEDKRKPGRTDELHAVQQFADTARRAVERIERTVPTDAFAIPPALIARVREGAYGYSQSPHKHSSAPRTHTQSPTQRAAPSWNARGHYSRDSTGRPARTPERQSS
ncbi:MAG TPA: hypothetical protein VK680_11705 [Solirubrobacteraceae bacterium]|nr:hypothetical protein [Solirubrobacteraceae bacterium]